MAAAAASEAAGVGGGGRGAEVVKAGGLPLLIKFLHVECPPEEGQAQVAATERVLQKSAIAVSRQVFLTAVSFQVLVWARRAHNKISVAS